MSERRAARHGRPRYTGNELPPVLAAGPCVEDWTPPGKVPVYFRAEDAASVRAGWALRAWSAAVVEWATATGWAREDRPARDARDLARTCWPWSREYLRGTGEGALVDYFEGRTDEHPDRPGLCCRGGARARA